MKFEEQKIIVKLGDEGDEAVITFNEPLETERFKLMESYKAQDYLSIKEVYRKNCISVENLFNSDGEAVTVQDIIAGNLRGSYADAIFVGYLQAIVPQETKEDTAKNE